MYTALIATRFAGDGLSQATAFRPAFGDSYPGVAWEDVVAIPSARLATLVKNVYIVRVTVPDAVVATLTAAGADANYRILWQAHYDDDTSVEDSGNRTAVLTSAQLSNIKAYLQARGYTAADLAGVTLPITREDAATALIALFRSAT